MPRKPAQPVVHVNVDLSPQLSALVSAYAKDNGLTRADAFRELLTKGLRVSAVPV